MSLESSHVNLSNNLSKKNGYQTLPKNTHALRKIRDLSRLTTESYKGLGYIFGIYWDIRSDFSEPTNI
ncbi:hypothetical protein L596_015831 [Steinernema carpocapsae]|uniref:Uncharacterized protein n=1 Tax=Steinernema carpocapsae TaxID=34508 RepID=A0A4U5NGT0_STECR|nr:hypothetical protein L596_015831 [Steinernema carpocapsae]